MSLRARSLFRAATTLAQQGGVEELALRTAAPLVAEPRTSSDLAQTPPPQPRRSFYKRQLPRDLIPFASPEGKRIFRDALEDGSVESFFPLVQHFQTQSEPASCALGTLCMVLNALGIDPALSWKGPWRWWSEELLLVRWEQAMQTLPAEERRCMADVRAAGMSLAEFGALSSNVGLHTVTHFADRSSLREFKEAIWEALGCGVGCGNGVGDSHRHTPFGGRGGTHVVVSFNRTALKQTGEGHFSPLGGYSRRHSAVLVMDVARFKYPPYWVPLETLWDAMHPPDPSTGRTRGYLVLKAVDIPRESDRCPLGSVAAPEPPRTSKQPAGERTSCGHSHAHHTHSHGT